MLNMPNFIKGTRDYELFLSTSEKLEDGKQYNSSDFNLNNFEVVSDIDAVNQESPYIYRVTSEISEANCLEGRAIWTTNVNYFKYNVLSILVINKVK